MTCIPYRLYVERAGKSMPCCTAAGSSYRLWGFTQLPGSQEPNRASGPEECAGANYTLWLLGAWGWSDAPCAMMAPFVCKIRRSCGPELWLEHAGACIFD